jgi:hypothetical protein
MPSSSITFNPKRKLTTTQGAPRPWHTKPGDSLLDARMAEVTTQRRRISSAGTGVPSEKMDLEKVHAAYDENKVL